MEVFEIHITGDESILKNGMQLGVKTIAVDLLKPDKSILRSEYMTSHIAKFNNFQDCVKFVDGLSHQLEQMGTKIIRKKIECPPYQHYLNSSLYMESHFKLSLDATPNFPISRNQNKDYLLGTDRTYDKSDYKRFHDAHQDDELELCLYDSFIDEDLDWLSLPRHSLLR